MELSTLGYNEKWIEYGFLNSKLLKEQIVDFRKSKDSNPCYYRYTTLMNWLKLVDKVFTDLEIEQYIALAKTDLDVMFSRSAIAVLFGNYNLSDTQFELVVDAGIKGSGEWPPEMVFRQKMMRKLETFEMTDELFDECYNSGDSSIARIALQKTEDMEKLSIVSRESDSEYFRNYARDRYYKLKKAKKMARKKNMR